MTLGAYRVSALALSAAAFVLSAPLSFANAATVAHNYHRVTHPRATPGMHGYVARSHIAHHHYAWRNGRRYAYGYNPGAYGYNPGAAVAAGVIGGALGAGLAGAYDCGGYGYSYGSCDDYGYGYGPYYGGFGYGYPGFGFGYGGYGGRYGYGRTGYGGRFGGAHFAGGNFGHLGGVGGGHFGGGGFGGGHMGGFGGGHFGGGGHFR